VNDTDALLLAWLLLAHLLADFVLQTDAIATAKFGSGPTAWRALALHAAIVGATTAPLALIYGLRGIGYVLLTVVTHLVIDRTKILLTLRDLREREAQASAASVPAPATPPADQAEPVDSPEATPEGPPLDQAWTPRPAALFAIDQMAHLGVLVIGWAVLLQGEAPAAGWVDLVNRLFANAGTAEFPRLVLVLVVLADLAIVDVRAGSMFVATLVRAPLPRAADRASAASPARIGATIGVMERLIVSALVLAAAYNAIGLVVAAKTVARFRQLDDRQFAEYYLLGTLASITVAILAALVAQGLLA
jgi:hypothetical protein